MVETQTLKDLEGSTFKIILLNNEEGIEPSIIIKSFVFKDTESYETVENGLETGVFNLRSNGSAQYSDAGLTMQGNWYMRSASNGYYDEYGY